MPTNAQPDDSAGRPLEDIIECYNAYIAVLARRYVPRRMVRPEQIEDEIEDIIQETRIRLWKTLMLKNVRILCLEAYIARIVRNLCRDIGRRRPLYGLPVDADGELQQGSTLILQNEGMQEPGYELEQREQLAARVVWIVDAILELPYKQRCAFIALLKKDKEITLPILRILKKRGIEVEAIQMASGGNTLARQRASLSVARKRLRGMYRVEQTVQSAATFDKMLR